MYEVSCMDDVIRCNKTAGWHFFDENAMEFFGSKVVSELMPGGLFVTEEDNFDRSKKLYTVRRFNAETAEIEDVSMFLAFPTLKEAMNAVKQLIEEGGEDGSN